MSLKMFLSDLESKNWNSTEKGRRGPERRAGGGGVKRSLKTDSVRSSTVVNEVEESDPMWTFRGMIKQEREGEKKDQNRGRRNKE